MTSPADPRKVLVKNWLQVAEEDLAAAAAAARNSHVARRIPAYHAQQAAEKFVKAALVFLQVEFHKRHDLAYLIGLLQEPAPLLAADLGFAEELSQYATAGRYPDDAEAVTASEARRAIQLAARVREIVLAHVAPRRKPKRKTGKSKRKRPAG